MPTNGSMRGARIVPFPHAGRRPDGMPSGPAVEVADTAERACLIEKIRNAVLDGTYHHDAFTIADRMIDRMAAIGRVEF